MKKQADIRRGKGETPPCGAAPLSNFRTEVAELSRMERNMTSFTLTRHGGMTRKIFLELRNTITTQ